MSILTLVDQLCVYRRQNKQLAPLRKIEEILDSLSNQEAFDIICGNKDKIKLNQVQNNQDGIFKQKLKEYVNSLERWDEFQVQSYIKRFANNGKNLKMQKQQQKTLFYMFQINPTLFLVLALLSIFQFYFLGFEILFKNKEKQNVVWNYSIWLISLFWVILFMYTLFRYLGQLYKDIPPNKLKRIKQQKCLIKLLIWNFRISQPFVFLFFLNSMFYIGSGFVFVNQSFSIYCCQMVFAVIFYLMLLLFVLKVTKATPKCVTDLFIQISNYLERM